MMRIINAGDRVMNTWIYEIPEGYVMVDTGYPGKLESVGKRMKRHGIQWSDIRCLFLTHAHDDHAGFLNELMEKCPHIQVIANPDSLPVLRKGRNPFMAASPGKIARPTFSETESPVWPGVNRILPPSRVSRSFRVPSVIHMIRSSNVLERGGKRCFPLPHRDMHLQKRSAFRVLHPPLNGFRPFRRTGRLLLLIAARGKLHDFLPAVYHSTMNSVPAPIRMQPIRDFAVNSSCRKTKASTKVITTLSLSMGTTFEVSPTCRAL